MRQTCTKIEMKTHEHILNRQLANEKTEDGNLEAAADVKDNHIAKLAKNKMLMMMKKHRHRAHNERQENKTEMENIHLFIYLSILSMAQTRTKASR